MFRPPLLILAHLTLLPRASPPCLQFPFPQAALSEPWSLLVHAVYKALAPHKVLHSLAHGGTWLTPAEAVYPDEVVRADGPLLGALVKDGLALVQTPSHICRLLHEFTVRTGMRAKYCSLVAWLDQIVLRETIGVC